MAQVVATASIRDVPHDILIQILSNLSERDLMTCRLVNHRWDNLAGRVLCEKSSLWKTTFASFERVSELASGLQGTRFSTPAQISRFILEMRGTPNPFPNGTVILIHDLNYPTMIDWVVQENAFQSKVCDLLDTFKDAILNLIYSIRVIQEGIDLSLQFRSILNLKKLKGLILYCGNTNDLKFLKSVRRQKLFKEISKEVTMPEKLTELNICGHKGIIPLHFIFGGFESILKSVSSLELCNGPDIASPIPPDPDECLDFPLHTFPKLKKLKVRNPEAEFLKQFQQFKPNCVPSLKEISLQFNMSPDADPIAFLLNLKETMELLDLHAATLELLHLDSGFMDSENVPDQVREMDSIGMCTPVKYSKLKTFVISYRDLNIWPMAFNELMGKLENLQEVKLILPDPPEESLRDQYQRVVACWNRFPATVKVINVPSYGWKVKRGETGRFD